MLLLLACAPEDITPTGAIDPLDETGDTTPPDETDTDDTTETDTDETDSPPGSD